MCVCVCVKLDCVCVYALVFSRCPIWLAAAPPSLSNAHNEVLCPFAVRLTNKKEKDAFGRGSGKKKKHILQSTKHNKRGREAGGRTVDYRVQSRDVLYHHFVRWPQLDCAVGLIAVKHSTPGGSVHDSTVLEYGWDLRWSPWYILKNICNIPAAENNFNKFLYDRTICC